jgi:predicted AAA+ superfamily ATPase
MKRYLDDLIEKDLSTKMVLVSGPRQVGKTTLCRQLMAGFEPHQYLNWDVALDRSIIQGHRWSRDTRLLVLDEIHKKPDWKSWLKGVYDGRSKGQSVLVTGSARMDTFRQSGESLAGRYFAYRLHPISVKEWVAHIGQTPQQALDRLMVRGGFPEPCLAEDAVTADRWRRQYATDLIREDVLEFSRLQEVKVMQLLVEMLRERVGSPLSYASLARDLAVSPATIKRYVDILQALFIVFLLPPWHRNVARALTSAPKLYFYDTGMVADDPAKRLENAMACMLLKHVHFQQDTQGQDLDLYYLRTKDGSEVDFVLATKDAPTHLLECKLTDGSAHRALTQQAQRFPDAQAIQLVKDCYQEQTRGLIEIRRAADWLARLAA